MGLTIADLKRAIAGGGDINSFAQVVQRALGNPPVPVFSLVDQRLPLPEPPVILESANREALSKVDLQVVAAPLYGKNTSRFVEELIEDVQPEAIALDISPSEWGAHMLYAFSLPGALGIPLQNIIQNKDSSEIYSSKSIYPGNMYQTAILKSWLKKVPLLPAGRPPKARRLEFIAEQGWFDLDSADNAQWDAKQRTASELLDLKLSSCTSLEEKIHTAEEISRDLIKTSGDVVRENIVNQALYAGSRILDIAFAVKEKNRKTRLLVLVEMGHLTDVQYVLGLLQKGILEETYIPVSASLVPEMVTFWKTSEQLQADAGDYLPGLDAFAKFIWRRNGFLCR